MKNVENVWRQILGFVLMIIAAVLGYDNAPEMTLSFAAVLGSVYLATNLIKPHVGGFWVQIVSWGWGMLLALAGWWLGWGIFSDLSLLLSVLAGFLISLAANGVYDSGWLEALWRLLKDLL